jgi:hypothetical protein
MSKLPIKKEFPYDKIRSWAEFNPFVICFIYPITGKPFCVKGGLQKIRPWLEKNLTCSHVMYETIWRNGNNRTYHAKVNLKGEYTGGLNTHRKMKEFYIAEYSMDVNIRVQDGWKMTVYRGGAGSRPRGFGAPREYVVDKKLKRPPRCFPEEFVQYCTDSSLYVKPKRVKKNKKNVQKVRQDPPEFQIVGEPI